MHVLHKYTHNDIDIETHRDICTVIYIDVDIDIDKDIYIEIVIIMYI
jgi:hypothetical protein